MKVRLKTIAASPTLNGQPGDIIDVYDDVARQLIDSRSAELVEDEEAAPIERKKKSKREKAIHAADEDEALD